MTLQYLHSQLSVKVFLRICLRIFCDETIAALESHPKINNEAASETVNFLKIVLKLWKYLM